jgi:Zn-dependent peptidase ImmA (M78 family)
MTTWKHLEGDTSSFAVMLSLQPDPDKSEFEDREYGDSWGTFQLWVDGRNLCAHHTRDEGSESVAWYLLPLLEWLADNWTALLHEERLPLRNRKATAAEYMTMSPPIPAGVEVDEYYEQLSQWQAWWHRHALESAADGGLYPRLFIRRWGDRAEVSWSSTNLVGAPESFRFDVPSGSVRLPVGEVAQALHATAKAAVNELLRRHPESARLQQLESTLAALSQGSQQERLAWLTGLGERFAEVWHAAEQAIQDFAGDHTRPLLDPTGGGLVLQGSPHLAVLFGTLSPNVTIPDVLRLTKAMLAVPAPSGDLPYIQVLASLEELRAEVEELTPVDFEQGNQLAEEVLGMFGIDDSNSIGITGLYADLGIRIDDVELTDASVRAVSIASDDHQATCFVNPSYTFGSDENIRRFSLAHELCHLLFDRTRAMKLAVASGPWAPVSIERRANAFAAALLLPRVLLDTAARRSNETYGSFPWVSDIAAHAKVGPTAVINRLSNLGILSTADRDRLLMDAGRA